MLYLINLSLIVSLGCAIQNLFFNWSIRLIFTHFMLDYERLQFWWPQTTKLLIELGGEII